VAPSIWNASGFRLSGGWVPGPDALLSPVTPPEAFLSRSDAPLDQLQRPMRDLRVSVTDRCNFRCPYCMPAEIFGEKYEFLPRPQLLRFEEIERLVRLFVGLGVEKLRITGGEPLLRHQLPRLIERLAAIDGLRDLTLTTNGYLLAKQAQGLARAGLQRVTVSLDSHDDATFARMNGRGVGTARVLEGIDAAARAGLIPVKINCVVERGVNEGSIVELARRFKDTDHVLRFIEYMDVGTLNDWNLDKVVTGREIVERIDAVFPLEPADPSYRGEVARRWRYRDGSGEIGVITSVSAPFCRDCTRARLTIEGKLVTCLFASGGTDLRGPLRAGASDDELRDLVAGVWSRRADRYSEERAARTAGDGSVPGRDRLEMYEIGG
jgi:cyclic pyranopterin phosphate synthase